MAKKQCCFNPKGHNLFLPNTDFVCFFVFFILKAVVAFVSLSNLFKHSMYGIVTYLAVRKEA